jgi:hypothetical protein
VEAVHHQPEDTLETDRSIDDGVGNTYDRAIRASLACSAADRAPVPRAQHARTHAAGKRPCEAVSLRAGWMGVSISLKRHPGGRGRGLLAEGGRERAGGY